MTSATTASAVRPAPATLALVGVSAVDRAARKPFSFFRRQAASPLGAVVDLRIELGAGVVAVVGTIEDGTALLVDLLAGKVRPDRGKVFVAGKEPSRSAEVRRAIGCLAPAPEILLARTVREAVKVSLALTGASAAVTAASVLDSFGLGKLGDRDPRSLSSGEARAVDLALALSTPAPKLIVLFEPWVDVAGISLFAVKERIQALGETALVVLVTSAPDDASLATTVLSLQRGVIARGAASTSKLGAFERTELHVWVASKGRELARALTESKDLLGVSFEANADPANDGGVLRVAGPDVSAVALALADAAVATGALVTGIGRVSPTLGEIRATTESVRYARYAAAHAAYRDAYAAEARRLEQLRAAQAPPPSLFAKTGAPSPPSVAPRAWAPASTPPPAKSVNEIAEEEAKWGPKAPTPEANAEQPDADKPSDPPKGEPS